MPKSDVYCPFMALVLGLSSSWAPAESFEARLVAERDCPATVSTKRPDNPGKVHLRPGETYAVIARNKTEASYYQVRIEGVRPTDRWVAAECGRLAGAGEPALSSGAVDGAGAPVSPGSRTRPLREPSARSMEGQFVLAASWQPAFCERRQGRPECRSQTPDRADARQFSLHGLWPQPIGNSFCGVSARERALSESGDWERLPALDLDSATRGALERSMPSTVSFLSRYQWTKHGSCYGTDADTYFDHAIALLDQLNGSSVQRLFEGSIGQRLRAGQVREAFDRAFGVGAGERVRLECDDGGLITELRIGLKGTISGDSVLGDLIRAAPTRTVGCRGGWVDRAGPGR